jgi:hypothetical protein
MRLPQDARGRLILRRMGLLWLVDLDWLTEAPGGYLQARACRISDRTEYFYGVACTHPQAELDATQEGRA